MVLSCPPGANEATPLIHDGVMLAHGFGDRIQALDAASGDLLWQYSRELPKGMNPNASAPSPPGLLGGILLVMYVIRSLTGLPAYFCMKAAPFSGGANSPSSVFGPWQLAQLCE